MNQIKKMLIVDDMEVNRAILHKLFESSFKIIEAVNGMDAIHYLEKERNIAIVLLDLQMPEVDGFAVLEYIQQDIRLSKIPVIVNTQYGEEENEKRSLQLGAAEFIVKPYNTEKFT